MLFLFLNQTFHPDVVATAQYLTEVARALAQRGHEVEVISSRRAYDDSSRTFPARESWHGINIRRVRTTHFGKRAKWRRAADFASFIAGCVWKLAASRKPDVVLALTSPPLISFIGACYAALRRCDFVYWVMDLNPDEAVAAGWLRRGSVAEKILSWMSVFSFQHAKKVIVLDRFMRDSVLARGIAPEKVVVLPPWSQDQAVKFDSPGRDAFRAAHGLTDKFVVMYSGNHSPCHPLNTLLEAARELAREERIVFCFVGGGSEFPKVREFVSGEGLKNIICLPYQPLDKLSGSLSAADLHVVVMGDSFVGTIHPCKVYNILSVESPVLYIGPAQSHIVDLFKELGSPGTAFAVRHGDAAGATQAIRSAASRTHTENTNQYRAVLDHFNQETGLRTMLQVLEGTTNDGPRTAN